MAFSSYIIEDLLNTGSFACEHIIHAARDVGMVKKEVFPTTMFDDGAEVATITEFDILRNEIDLEHLKISKSWLKECGISSEDRKKLRQKWNHGWQSILWVLSMGCPWLTFEACCQHIDDALRLINAECRGTHGMLLDPERLAERILEEPEKMCVLFEEVQGRIRKGTVKNGEDAIFEDWSYSEGTMVIGWAQCLQVVPAGWGKAMPAVTDVHAKRSQKKLAS